MFDAFVTWSMEHRAQLVPLVFGFVALYWLLPRERPVLRPVGILIGLVSLGGLSFTLLPPGMTLHGVLFYLFSGVAIVAAATTVTHHNPIYSALSFALATLSVCGLFLLRGAQFLAAATVIIYAGAIVVTFLFIIMLARQSGNAPYDRRAREPFLATLASFVLLGALLFTIDAWGTQRAGNPPTNVPQGRLPISETSGMGSRSLAGFVAQPKGTAEHSNSNLRPGEGGTLRGLGRSLFTDYLVIVELAGTLLLVAGVGAVAIAPRRPSGKL
jgi:NADH-quinone oxidoreductase subunit J